MAHGNAPVVDFGGVGLEGVDSGSVDFGSVDFGGHCSEVGPLSLVRLVRLVYMH